LTVNVFEVVPPARLKPVASDDNVNPLTELGVMAPKPMVRAGVVVFDAPQDAVTPLLADAVVTEVTVPPLPLAVKVPALNVKPLPTVITSGFPAAAVLLPSKELVAICCIFAKVTALAPMVNAGAREVVPVVVPVTSPVGANEIDWLAVR
jgi:hypothetical protein